MFARIMCPACEYKFSIPEGDMGKRQVCANCKSPFIAGKSVAEAAQPEISMKLQPAAEGAYNKTMLVGSGAPPIKFDCPRCKKPLEAPASEAGMKKPCSECGQRLQVPAASTPAAAPPAGLNKTLLVSDESTAPPIRYNCPNCKKPLESPAIEALSKKNCPSCGQRFQIPAASTGGGPKPNLNKTVLASDESKAPASGASAGAPAAAASATTTTAPQPAAGKTGVSRRALAIGGVLTMFAGILIVLLLLTCLIGFFAFSGDRKALADAQKEIETMKAKLQKDQEIAERKIDQDKRDAEARMAEIKNRELLNALIANKSQKAEADDKLQRDREDFERRKQDQQLTHEREMAKIRADAATAAAQAAAINAQRPLWYHPGYYYRGYWYP